MVFAYIAVAAVVGLLIGFVTLSVIWTARKVEQSIRDRSISLLSTYDDLLEERSRQLAGLEEELDRLEAELTEAKRPSGTVQVVQTAPESGPTDFLRAAERISTTAYRDSGAGEVYRRVREAFAFDPQTVLENLPIPQGERSGGPAGELLRTLPFDTVYRLSTLPGEEQYELLRQTLSQKSLELLEAYAAGHSRFDCIEFYDHLKARAAGEPGPICLRVSPKAAAECPAQVRVVADPEICEGLQVEADNVLYDYCVKVREIG